MAIIKVNEFLNTAFGYKDAEILNSAIDKCLDKSEYPLIIDFSGITDYSILFFNLSLCTYIVRFEKNEYDRLFMIQNLSDTGGIAYNACYNNTANNPYSKNPFASKRIKTLYRIWNEEDFKENATGLKCLSQR